MPGGEHTGLVHLVASTPAWYIATAARLLQHIGHIGLPGILPDKLVTTFIIVISGHNTYAITTYMLVVLVASTPV